jgi:hypothetical protein
MLQIDYSLQTGAFESKLQRFWELSASKIRLIENHIGLVQETPVFTKQGVYTSQGWTDWTQGFQFGSAILQADATGESAFLELGRKKTIALMAPHLTHFGVHDHGFNNVSTYGNLWRLMNEGKLEEDSWERACYEIALKCSGAVQAKRWTALNDGGGFIYSFNGPHSLFIDTIRTLRSLAVAHMLGHILKDENDMPVSLLERLLTHARTTARYAIYYGEGRDSYDVRGRVAHESIFNVNDRKYRCPNSQQGFSAFTTWTRGLAWAVLGFAEELEFLNILSDEELSPFGGRNELENILLNAARATSDFYIEHTPSDGIPYWDTGAPQLHKIGAYLEQPADPFNPFEPVDSSAAAITSQGLLRLGRYLQSSAEPEQAKRYWQAGLTVLNTLLDEPYLSTDKNHQGLILHSLYHRPNGWDHIPADQHVPCGESTMWGDYHAREVALYVHRMNTTEPYLTFWGNFHENSRGCPSTTAL